MKANQANGNAVNSNGKGNQTNNAALKVVKDEPVTAPPAETPKAEVPKIELPKPPTVAEQRERLQTLDALFEKEGKLQDSHHRLKTFVLSTDEFNNRLTLKDGKGAEFNTGNPEVIKEVIALLQSSTADKIKQVQAQIQAA